MEPLALFEPSLGEGASKPAEPKGDAALVLSINGTERTDLRTGVVLVLVIVFVAGYAIGVWRERKKK